jgi:hypothetical protein
MAEATLTIEIRVLDIEATWDKGDPDTGISPGWVVADIAPTAVLLTSAGVELGTVQLSEPLRGALIDQHYDELSEAYAKEQP